MQLRLKQEIKVELKLQSTEQVRHFAPQKYRGCQYSHDSLLYESFAQCSCLHWENRGLLWRYECSFEGQWVCVGVCVRHSWSVQLREILCLEVAVRLRQMRYDLGDEMRWDLEVLNLLTYHYGMLISFRAAAECSVCFCAHRFSSGKKVSYSWDNILLCLH